MQRKIRHRSIYERVRLGWNQKWLSEPTSKVCFGGLKDLILGIVKGMGLKGSIQFFKDMKASGTSLESKLKEAHQDFVQIEMLVVKRAYQNQGYMRKLVQIAFD